MDMQRAMRYDISWKVLETSETTRLPQHRHRVFIVGVLKSKQAHDMRWPAKARGNVPVLAASVGAIVVRQK